MFSKLITLCSLATALNAYDFKRFVTIELKDMVVANRDIPKDRTDKMWVKMERRFGEDRQSGVQFGGQAYAGYKTFILPKTGVPITSAMSSKGERAVRLVFLPGFGSTKSHAGPILASSQLVKEAFAGAAGEERPRPVTSYFAQQHPNLAVPVEVVHFDLPGSGWGPNFDDFPTMMAIGEYIGAVIREMQELDPFPTLVVARSASVVPSVLTYLEGTPLNGVFGFGSTYPDAKVLEENLADVKRAELAREYQVLWPVLNGILERLGDPRVLPLLEKIKRSPRGFLALSGHDDGQTSATARAGWDRLLGKYGFPELLGPALGHVTIKSLSDYPANHFLFTRPEKNKATGFERAKVFTPNDPDIVTMYWLFRFIRDRVPMDGRAERILLSH